MFFQASTDGEQQLKELDEDIVEYSQKLLDVSEEMIKILGTVSSCLAIIQWLRQNLKGKRFLCIIYISIWHNFIIIFCTFSRIF